MTSLGPTRRASTKVRLSTSPGAGGAELPCMEIDDQVERIRIRRRSARTGRGGPGPSTHRCPAARAGTSRCCSATSATSIAGRPPSSGNRLPERLQRDFGGPAGRDGLLESGIAMACRDAHRDLAGRFSPKTRSGFGGRHRTRSPSGRDGRPMRPQCIDATPSPLTARSRHSRLSTRVDAIDEWFGLAVRRARAPDGGGRILRLVATDAGSTWNLIIGEEGRGHKRPWPWPLRAARNGIGPVPLVDQPAGYRRDRRFR